METKPTKAGASRSAKPSVFNLKVEFDREVDGRWIAEIVDVPGVMAYGATEKEAMASAQALALRVLADCIEQAITSFDNGPFILQEFFKGRLVEQPFYNPATESIETLVGRVRLCPYYFVLSDKEVRLGGALATIVPADKKIVHGMRDAIMVPTAVELRSSKKTEKQIAQRSGAAVTIGPL